MNDFQFEVVSGFVNLSDPCYTPSLECGVYSLPAKSGKWFVSLEYGTEGRVSGWSAVHEDYHNIPGSVRTFKTFDDLGVDSGQFGIFDVEIYDAETEFEDEEKFYGACCKVTLDKDQAGTVMNRGFVSSSGFGDGFGDGEYVGEGVFFENKLIGFSVEFIQEHKEEDDEDLWDEDLWWWRLAEKDSLEDNDDLAEDFLINKSSNL